jgi:AraC-like DNA-binding protein
VTAYKNLLHQSDKKLRLAYADSMVYAAKKTRDNDILGAAYLTRGIAFYGEKQQMKALDNYLIANQYISQTNDDYLIHKVKYNIAHIKYYLGFYDEAIALFKDCIAYFRNDNDRAYLNAIHSLGLCYNRTGKFSLCTEMNNLGLAEGVRLNNTEMVSYFRHSEGINQYFKKNYEWSLMMLKQSLPAIAATGDFANVAVANFYMGKCYWDMGRQQQAIPYFRKVDEAFNSKQYIRPDLRENYELLIRYYTENDNLKIRLHYIDQLLKADRILEVNFKYLSGKIHKEYDTKKLLEDKKQAEDELRNRDRLDTAFIIFIVLLFFTVLYLVYRHLKNKKHYQQKFQELLARLDNDKDAIPVTRARSTGTLDINEEVANDILKKLEKFESRKKFLDKDLTLVRLSEIVGSNTKYTSRIISHYRNKKYIDYINDLRIGYIINLLKNDSKYRLYTNKALAQESGFSTTQHFTKAFTANTGITPTYFVLELKKSIASENG